MLARLVKLLPFCLCSLLLVCLTACDGSSASTNATPVAGTGTSTTSAGSPAVDATPTAPPRLGTQPCPTAVSEPSYWDPIVNTEQGVNAVTSVTCANLTNDDSLQAVVVSVYSGPGSSADVYVFTNITTPSPDQIFKLHNLYQGSAKISAYNTLMTAEVDQGSSVNVNKSAGSFQPDLFREFAWSQGAGTLVPVSFPGIYPNLTRYEAERDQQLVNQGSLALLNAAQVASNMAVKLLNWPTSVATRVVSGGGSHDTNVVVSVKNGSAGTISVALGRLEGNTHNGIWEVTSVTSNGLAINSPPNRDLLDGATTVTGTGTALSGNVGTLEVLDHLYNTVGTTTAKGAESSGSTAFSTSISYKTSFKGGAQAGLLMLLSPASGTTTGVVILNELLNA